MNLWHIQHNTIRQLIQLHLLACIISPFDSIMFTWRFYRNIIFNAILLNLPAVFSLSQNTMFTWYKCTGDLNTHGLSGVMGYFFQRDTKFNVKVIHIFLLEGCSTLSHFLTCFLEELHSSYPTVVSLNLQIQHNISLRKF